MKAVNSKGQLSASFFAVAVLLLTVVYGLIYRPIVLEQPALALEIVFLIASAIVVSQALLMGHSWPQLINAILIKLNRAFPIILLLFAIGILIGSWMISGTIPMLIYLGLDMVSVQHIYLTAFVVPIIFSLCTGSSWSTIATLGLVLITVGQVVNADLAMLTGAIVGGAYFGDKLSPLSDTTNIAAIAVEIEVQQHIKAMLTTTVPAAFLSACLYFVLGYVYPTTITSDQMETLVSTKFYLTSLFDFNVWLLLPPVLILWGSIKRWHSLPTLILSSIVASILALLFQQVSVTDLFNTLHKGFNVDMLSSASSDKMTLVYGLLNRGGIYALIEPIVITILVFIYVGTIDQMRVIPTIVSSLLHKVNNQKTLITSTLFASGLTNALTSSQYANSFIVGEAFSLKYKEMGVPAPILSRSIEDTGTMIESLVPWSTTAVFIYASLGVSVGEYWSWQFLSLINMAIAIIFAQLGVQYLWKRTKRNDS
ncbi:Na+/H+ antiporter NhaC family protein [Thalassotalea sp. 1_MG-2023]|uniref:Na+/H+ antiporter NhaC family protein n=1 Tax=Thalassotalea sp. 1_MG-2023 TaxID=3062680 RepID=UPI0026E4037B|nr:Na+/H+ antiporter NhaC family protein [Thalassotalea sp. 1_MG-2023]MDO6426099.1 Na+/H+ antiporter NhaC family protein [Thalassotalea sp. 1_MG-2023]